MNPVIAYSTDAGACQIEFTKGSVPAAFILDVASGWTGTETIPAYYIGADGTRKTPVLDSDGNAFEFSTTNKALPVYFPCNIRIEKPTTAAAVGINLY